MNIKDNAQAHSATQEKAGSTPARWQRSGETRGGSIPRNGTGSQRPAWPRRYGALIRTHIARAAEAIARHRARLAAVLAAEFSPGWTAADALACSLCYAAVAAVGWAICTRAPVAIAVACFLGLSAVVLAHVLESCARPDP